MTIDALTIPAARRGFHTNKFVLLFVLYLAQAIPANFFISAFPVLLRDGGASLQSIGMLNLLFLPTILRPVWAPLVDGRFTYKAWIVSMQVTCMGLMWSLHAVDFVKQFALMYTIAFTYSIFSATQSIGVDGLAVRVLQPAERPRGGGVRTAGEYLGTIVGAGGLLFLFARIGLTPLVAINVGVLALPLIAFLWFPSPPSAAVAEPMTVARVVRFFRRPGVGAWAAVLFFFNAGTVLAGSMSRPLLVDHGITLDQMGILFGFVNPVLSILGCFAAPRVINWLGRRRSLITFGLLMAVENAMYLALLPKSTGVATVYALFGLVALTQGFPGILLYTILQDKCRAGTEGTDFSLQISVNLAGIMTAGIASGYVAGALGYRRLFLTAFALQLLVVGAIALFLPARLLEPEARPAS